MVGACSRTAHGTDVHRRMTDDHAAPDRHQSKTTQRTNGDRHNGDGGRQTLSRSILWRWRLCFHFCECIFLQYRSSDQLLNHTHTASATLCYSHYNECLEKSHITLIETILSGWLPSPQTTGAVTKRVFIFLRIWYVHVMVVYGLNGVGSQAGHS